MTRNDPHELHALSPTDPASEPHAPTVVTDDATSGEPDAEPTPESAAALADDARVSLTMGVLAWLPLRLWTDCGVCLFWRGAVVGALAAGALATVVSVLV